MTKNTRASYSITLANTVADSGWKSCTAGTLVRFRGRLRGWGGGRAASTFLPPPKALFECARGTCGTRFSAPLASVFTLFQQYHCQTRLNILYNHSKGDSDMYERLARDVHNPGKGCRMIPEPRKKHRCLKRLLYSRGSRVLAEECIETLRASP